MTKQEFIMMNLPDQYDENYDLAPLIIDGCDVYPELIHFVMYGKTKAHYDKFDALCSIAELQHALEVEEITEEEKQLIKAELEESIELYNSIIIN